MRDLPITLTFILLTIVCQCYYLRLLHCKIDVSFNGSRNHFTDGSVFLSVDLKDRLTKGSAACCFKIRRYITVTTKILFKISWHERRRRD